MQTERHDINQETTGVYDTQDNENMETEMETEAENVETAGVDSNDMTRTEYIQENNISTPNEENKPDNYITVADINIMSELNASNRESDVTEKVLKGIEYNSSTKGKSASTSDIVTTGSTENCESEKLNTEVENDKKVSFDNVTNVG